LKAQTLYSFKRILPAYIVWWLFWAVVQTFVLHRLGANWHVAMLDALLSNSLLALTGTAALIIYKYYQPGKNNRLYRLLHGFGITVLYMAILHWLLQCVFYKDPSYLTFLDLSMSVRFMFSLLMILFITLLNWLLNNMLEQKEQENRRNEAEQLVKDAELVKLRQQLQPHFLFNSLNSISALAGSKPDEARKMIQQLSDFLRGTLKKDEDKTVSIKEELEHLKLYLEIERVRFGHRLNIEIKVNEETLKAQIPPLLLQPIVENAIKFGLYGTLDEIVVTIEAQAQEGHLSVEIKNPFDAQTQSSGQGTGFGLSSIQRRLFLLYTRNDLLITEKKENIFITRLKIPQ
jgi:two-component system LytT family sensor kinase